MAATADPHARAVLRRAPSPLAPPQPLAGLTPAADTAPAMLVQRAAAEWVLSGHWTLGRLGRLPQQLPAQACQAGPVVLDGRGLAGMDSAGAWLLQRWLRRHGATADLRHWPARCLALMQAVAGRADAPLARAPQPAAVETIGRASIGAGQEALAMLGFMGQVALTALGSITHPQRMRWRAMWRQVQIGGFDALPIIGLTSFLLGVVVAYQGADQLRHYGANIFVVDLVGYAMLREFAPLISAIIIAGRSGSAYSAQIGTMVVTEEIDAMRTIAIDPIEVLVLPKLLALALVLPLLTVFADLCGVFGGMVMARSQLGIGYHEFIERFGHVMQGATLLVGVGKSLVFAVVIALIGCFQGFRTRGSADSVGQQTTKSVVQSIFLVIVADGAFSVAFNVLGL